VPDGDSNPTSITGPPRLEAVFFDADGVLIDSLSEHLAFCADEVRKFNLPVRVPPADAFRSIVAGGAPVSPMLAFFSTVGFPEEYAHRAAADYEREFHRRYRPERFAGTDAMLAEVQRSGLTLGLVTANTRRNIESEMGDAMHFFDPRCTFFLDTFAPQTTKAWCLEEGARRLDVAPQACAYVGDQPDDRKAAHEAGCRFVGVAYGWGITSDQGGSQTARSVSALPKILSPATTP